mgnify:CR=1 FL=1
MKTLSVAALATTALFGTGVLDRKDDPARARAGRGEQGPSWWPAAGLGRELIAGCRFPDASHYLSSTHHRLQYQ